MSMIKASINSNSWARWDFPFGDCAQRGKEAISRIFAIDSKFNTVPANDGIDRANCFAGGDAQLFANEIEARDLFTDRVFYLEAGINFKK